MYLVVLLLSAATAFAFPQSLTSTTFESRQDVAPWVAAGPNDSRSPCPMLNTLANHGYLPHDGRGISVQDMAEAAYAALNFNQTNLALVAQGAFALLGSPDVIDLEDLNTPNATEHTASLTREDHASGDSLHFSAARLEALLADSATDYLTVESLAKSRARVEGSSSPPEPPLTEREIAQAGFEAALVVMIMSEDATWSTDDYAKTQSPKDRVAVWMREEKLPVELGWHAPSHSFTLAALNRISAAILVAQAGLYARNGLGSGK